MSSRACARPLNLKRPIDYLIPHTVPCHTISESFETSCSASCVDFGFRSHGEATTSDRVLLGHTPLPGCSPIPPFPHTSSMSQTRPNSESKAPAPSNSNYQHIFSVALESYRKRTGNDLTSNPLLPRLETCNSPDAVISLLRAQTPGFDQSRSGDDSERLSNWLIPTVNVIVAFSGTINQSVGLVGPRVFH